MIPKDAELQSGSLFARTGLSALRAYEILFVLVYPAVLIFTNSVRLLQVFWSLLSLKTGLANYLRLSAGRSLNSSWHRCYHLLLRRYGRSGYNYDCGIGTSLASQFALTRLSMRLYHDYEIIVPWLGTLIGVLLHVVWCAGGASCGIVLAVVACGLFSTIFYFIAFEALKYDSLGWTLVPLGYYFLLSDNLIAFAVVVFLITFLSVSVAIVQGALWFALALVIVPQWAVVLFIPAGLKLATHFAFMFVNWRSLLVLLSGIGLTGSGAARRSLRLGPRASFITMLWCVFAVGVGVILYPFAEIRTMLIAGVLAVAPILMLIVNNVFRRFADDQTMYALGFFSFSCLVIASADWRLLPLLWIALSPPPVMFGFVDWPNAGKNWWLLPRRTPYDRRPVDQAVAKLFEAPESWDRILYDFDYDDTKYPDFDGLRQLREYLQYHATCNRFFLVPDFYLVFDSYAGRFPLTALYEDRSPVGRLDAMNRIGARFLLLQSSTEELDQPWRDAGFKVAGRIDQNALQERGVWSPPPVVQRYLLLLSHPETQHGIVGSGELLAIEPNRIRLRLDAGGKAVVRFMHDAGWGGATVTVTRAEGALPWIAVDGEAGADVEITYDYFGNAGKS